MNPFADPRTFAMQDELQKLAAIEALRQPPPKVMILRIDGELKIEFIYPEPSPQYVEYRDYLLRQLLGFACQSLCYPSSFRELK